VLCIIKSNELGIWDESHRPQRVHLWANPQKLEPEGFKPDILRGAHSMIPTPPPNPCGLSDSGIDIISRCVIVCFCETTY